MCDTETGISILVLGVKYNFNAPSPSNSSEGDRICVRQMFQKEFQPGYTK